MSWYSKIYTTVRAYKSQNPISGWILERFLNILLICQVLGQWTALVIYIHITLGYYVTNVYQATIFLIIAFFLIFMSTWCLLRTIFTPTARVPDQYKPSKELDEQLKSKTPLVNGKYVVEKSSPEQVREQGEILETMCRAAHIKVAECDQVGRIKYCYECGHIKPDRCRHCSSCGQCTVRFDHHCPWINKCVSHSNYKYFLLYVFYTTCFAIWYLVTSLEGVVRYFIIQKWKEDAIYLAIYLLTYVLGCIMGYYPLGELLIFHYQLITLNETTCEQTKPAVLRNDNQADYNMGQAENFRQVFGWGMHFLPIESNEIDGIHYEIRYVNNQSVKYVRAVVGDSENATSSDTS